MKLAKGVGTFSPKWTWGEVEAQLRQLQATGKLAEGRIDERTAQKLAGAKTFEMLPNAFAEWVRLAVPHMKIDLVQAADDMGYTWDQVLHSYKNLSKGEVRRDLIEEQLEDRIEGAKKATQTYLDLVGQAVANIAPAQLQYEGFKIYNPDRMPEDKLNAVLRKIEWLVSFFKAHGMLSLLQETLSHFTLWLQSRGSVHATYDMSSKRVAVFGGAYAHKDLGQWRNWVEEVFIHELGHHVHMKLLHPEAVAVWDAPWKGIEQKQQVRDTLSGEDRQRFFKLLEGANFNPSATAKTLKGLDKIRFAEWLRRGFTNMPFITPKTFRPTKHGKKRFDFLRDPHEWLHKEYGYTLDSLGDKEREEIEDSARRAKETILLNLGLSRFVSKTMPLSQEVLKELKDTDPSIQKAIEALEIPTEYGKEDVREDFAETFVAFMTRGQLSQQAKFRMQQALAISGLYGKSIGKYASMEERVAARFKAAINALQTT